MEPEKSPSGGILYGFGMTIIILAIVWFAFSLLAGSCEGGELADVTVTTSYYSALNTGDLLSTEYARGYGAGERNPFGQTYRGRLGLKIGISAGLAGVDLGLQALERRRVTSRRPGCMPETRRPFTSKAATAGKWAMRGVALAYYARLTIRNVGVGNDLRRGR